MFQFADRIRPHVQHELDRAVAEETRGHFHSAFRHLERAHVLGQMATREHLRVHARMFTFALRQRCTAEAWGQVWRLATAALLTLPGLVPLGNTGGSRVNGLRRMPIPRDLQQLIDAARRAPTTRHNHIPA